MFQQNPLSRRALVTTLQHALTLVRGPFLDGFWLGEEALAEEAFRRLMRVDLPVSQVPLQPLS